MRNATHMRDAVLSTAVLHAFGSSALRCAKQPHSSLKTGAPKHEQAQEHIIFIELTSSRTIYHYVHRADLFLKRASGLWEPVFSVPAESKLSAPARSDHPRDSLHNLSTDLRNHHSGHRMRVLCRTHEIQIHADLHVFLAFPRLLPHSALRMGTGWLSGTGWGP
jgi:hypothetical protein